MNIKPDNKNKTQKDLLSFDVYKLFNISIADISKMSEEDVKKVNKEIYKSFDISDSVINKEYLLEEIIKALKNYSEPITTGNGYVDILLIMSIIVTGFMVVVIFSSIIF